MKIHDLTIRFNSPAFLGGADQRGAWRTPPFKAQLRHWWRMVHFSKHGFDLSMSDLLTAESNLFGSAGTGSDGSSSKSRVRLRLDHWRPGTLDEWRTLVKRIPLDSESFVGGDRYMAYGPVSQRGTLTNPPAIAPDETAVLSIAYNDQDSCTDGMTETLGLLSQFGAVGGRSRNGWGSYELADGDGILIATKVPMRDWTDCLAVDWPHAIGSDAKGALVWQTKESSRTWDEVMSVLADTRMRLRETFKFDTGVDSNVVEDRHWLAYPVTKHPIKKWAQLRLPNSMRMKVLRDTDGRFTGQIFHVPHKPPAGFGPPGDLTRIWGEAHDFLDDQAPLVRAKDFVK